MNSINIKSLALATTILATAGAAHAVSPVATIGIKAGITSMNSQVEGSGEDTAGTNNIFNAPKSDMGSTGFDGQVNLGLGAYLCEDDKFYLGIEPFFGYSNSKSKTSLSLKNISSNALVQRNISLKKRQSFGATFKAGVNFNKMAMPFVKLGIVSTKFKLNSDSRSSIGFTGSSSTSKNLTGLILGLGIDVPVNAQLSVGVEYTHTRYNSIKLRQEIQMGGTEFHTVKMSPRSNDFHVTLNYKFYDSAA